MAGSIGGPGLVAIIAAGVGLFTAIGFVRIVKGFSMTWLLAAIYSAILLLSFFAPANLSGNTNTRGSSPLIRAANNGDVEMVKLLLEKGADATMMTADRQTAIHAAIGRHSLASRSIIRAKDCAASFQHMQASLVEKLMRVATTVSA